MWLGLLVALALVCSVLRGVLALFLGREGASHAMAILFIGTFRLVARVLVGVAGELWRLLSRAAERGDAPVREPPIVARRDDVR